MDQIRQQFEIDVQGALQALRTLDSGFETFDSRLRSTASSIKEFNQSANVRGFDSFEAGAKRASASAKQLGSSISSTRISDFGEGFDILGQKIRTTNTQLDNSTKSANNFTVSWETLTRVVATQLIVRTMSQIRDALRASVSEAIQLQKAVSLIQTIAPDAGLAQIGDSVRDISDSLNLPLLQTAEGLYNAISNQVGNFNESLIFTARAGEFAKATNSSLADSVDLLSAALRAYDLTVADTGRVSGVFFSAIDKGRVTADELANTIGRVLEPASELGIELEEISAGVAAISEKGLSASESLTQFRGIVNALTKPSESLKDTLRDLGFESAEAGVQSLGLGGLLEELANSTDGTAQSFAKLFPNIRGIGGALGLTGENFKTFSADLDAARSSGAEFADERFLIAIANEGEQLTASINRVKNAFTSEFGNAFITFANDAISAAGGADSLVTAIEILTPTVLRGGTALLTLAAATKALSAAGITGLAGSIGGFAAALGPIGALAIAAGAGVSVFNNALEARAIEARIAPLKELEAETKRVLDAEREAGALRVKNFEDDSREIVKIVGAFAQDLGKEYNKAVDAGRDADDQLIRSSKSAIEQIVSDREELVKGLTQSLRDTESIIADSQKRISSLTAERDDFEFEASISGLDDAGQAFEQLRRASDLAREARRDLNEAAAAGDKAAIAEARQQFQRAQGAAEEALAIGQRTNNRGIELEAASKIQGILDSQIAGEKELTQIQQQRQAALEQQRAQQEEILNRIKEQAKIVIDNTGSFGQDGRLLEQDDLADRQRRREAALREIASLQLGSDNFEVADFSSIVQTLDREFQNQPIQIAFNAENATRELVSDLQNSLSSLKLPFLEELEQVTGREIRTPDQLVAGLAQAREEAAGLLRQYERQNEAVNTQERRLQEARAALSDLQNNSDASTGSSASGPAAAIADATRSLQQLSEDGQVSLDGVRGVFRDFIEDVGDARIPSSLLDEVEALKKAFGDLAEVAKLQDQEFVTEDQQESLRELANLFGSVVGASGQLGDGIESSDESFNQAIENASTLEDRLRAAAEASRDIQIPTLQIPTTQGAFFGNTNFQAFNTGGTGVQTRGSDTIPALLSPGESIINRKSTLKFNSQLQAINAGQPPAFRRSGDTITNFKVGDINVQGGSNGAQTARQIKSALDRLNRKRHG